MRQTNVKFLFSQGEWAHIRTHTHCTWVTFKNPHTNTHTPHKLKLKINLRWSTNQLLHKCRVGINSGEFPPSPNSNSTCLGKDECITFYISHPLLFSIKLTRNGAVSSANWQNWAWFNPVAWLCGWKSYSSTGGERIFALWASAKSYSSHSIPSRQTWQPESCYQARAGRCQHCWHLYLVRPDGGIDPLWRAGFCTSNCFRGNLPEVSVYRFLK